MPDTYIMENDEKVFHSEISRVDCETESNLYDLLKIKPAIPITHHSNNLNNGDVWEFKPDKEKIYSPKYLKSKIKVSTVSDVRTLFERDVSGYLVSDLEQQQNYLLRKIRDGSSTEEKTRKTAMTLLSGDNPISRRSWHMLSNINPEKHKHSKQYVLWHGKRIQVNGSRGGKTKFICNHDLNKKVQTLSKKCPRFKTMSTVRNGLLKNSLKVKFKPGPLGMKKNLDDSHHKYHMGEIELVTLPAPVLEISPTHGKILEPTICNFVNNLRGETGEISQKYAEFAVTVLGSLQNNTLSQMQDNRTITFDLKYKCEQSRVLMRHDSRSCVMESSANSTNVNGQHENQSSISSANDSMCAITQMMNEMLNTVEISMNQDKMYSGQDEVRDSIADDKEPRLVKDRLPKRKYCELDKLDVTIIKIPENSKTDIEKSCDKAYCAKGCVCESLDCVLRLKQHCGLIDCMFGCKCEVSKFKNLELLEVDSNDIIPGILNLDNELNSHLAKEEQKFHQTIVFSGEKSIVLKSRKRNSKISSKYAEFYTKLNIKSDKNLKKILTVNVERLPCQNIEPLCMVHNLYKCFCKGKFTETYVFNQNECNSSKINTGNIKDDKGSTHESDSGTKSILRCRPRKSYENTTKFKSFPLDENRIDLTENRNITYSCARTIEYQGRNYPREYYVETNRKISEMEKNDSLLKKKMLRLVNGINDMPISNNDKKDSHTNTKTVTNEVDIDDTISSSESEITLMSVPERLRNESAEKNYTLNKDVPKNKELMNTFGKPGYKPSFKKWLEINYRQHRNRLAKGINTTYLGPPTKDKASLHSWDFILTRYKKRKNIFFVTKTEPYRTFLAVDSNHSFFIEQCINIDTIHIADLPKYPNVIRNLVTNSSDSENSFCILYGSDHWWELIGSAVRVFEKNQPNTKMSIGSFGSSDSDSNNWENNHVGVKSSIDQELPSSWKTQISSEVAKEDNSNHNDSDNDIKVDNDHLEKAKWFVMQIENDVTEIQFYKKGFFVTYASIRESIKLARSLGKTIRISRTGDDTTQFNANQYGIYAIPCLSECCVFIGPYDLNEPLGIEVVKPISDDGNCLENQNKTRGVWINTYKLENSQVIDNPLAYLPSNSLNRTQTWINFNGIPNKSPNKSIERPTDNTLNSEKESISNKRNLVLATLPKQIKPIKIRRTNEFYQLKSDKVLRKVLPKHDLFTKKEKSVKNVLLKLKPVGYSNKATIASTSELALPGPSTARTIFSAPDGEIAPQIKIANVYSEKNLDDEPKESFIKSGFSMFVLKPEEINNKILANTTIADEIMSSDVEKLLETSTTCVPSQDVLVISDGEDESETSNDAWIQCCNIKNFGFIRAKTNDDNTNISFEFPGFKYSEFYEESDAFDKINQVLARKIYIPRNIKLEWQVVRDKRHLTSELLTSKCLEDKKYLLSKLRLQSRKKASLLKVTFTKPNVTTTSVIASEATSKNKDNQFKLTQDFEETSRKLEQENSVLLTQALTKKEEILNSLSVPDDLKVQMSEALKEILALNEP